MGAWVLIKGDWYNIYDNGCIPEIPNVVFTAITCYFRLELAQRSG